MEIIKGAWICCKDGSAIPIAFFRESENEKFIYIDLDGIYDFTDKEIKKVER